MNQRTAIHPLSPDRPIEETGDMDFENNISQVSGTKNSDSTYEHVFDQTVIDLLADLVAEAMSQE